MAFYLPDHPESLYVRGAVRKFPVQPLGRPTRFNRHPGPFTCVKLDKIPVTLAKQFTNLQLIDRFLVTARRLPIIVSLLYTFGVP